MEINWACKPFLELTTTEIYEILALRSEVFVVEQNCVFHDMDGKKDFESFHLFGKTIDNQIVAYTRILPANLAFKYASIGRVVNSPKLRGKGIGKILMEKSIESLYQIYGKVPIEIGAQYYLKSFYESFGFVISSEIYLEDDIEHIEMIKMP
jgi:ElaA protein